MDFPPEPFSKIPHKRYYANLGDDESLYTITFKDDGTFETCEQGPFPNPTLIKRGRFVYNGRFTLDTGKITLTYTDMDPTDGSKDPIPMTDVVEAYFRVFRKTVIHAPLYPEIRGPLTTHTVLRFDRTPLPYDLSSWEKLNDELYPREYYRGITKESDPSDSDLDSGSSTHEY